MPTASSKMPSFAGAVIDGRYNLIRLLGSGSYGVVYRAVDLKAPSSNSDRAIKIVAKADMKDSALSALRTEAMLHARASPHPNVVTLHDSFEDDKYFFFIMDYCRGGDLSDHLETKGPYEDDGMVRSAILSLVDAVEWLHNEGIYHRDLKPQNILLSEDARQFFIADFGLASESNTYDRNCGTPAFMPPECVDPDQRTRSGAYTDAWAVGLILLNMLSGITPWARARRSQPIYAAFVDDPNFLIDALPNISSGANKLVRRTLRSNPLIRASISDMRAMVDALPSFFIPYPPKSPSESRNPMVPYEEEGEELPHMRSTYRSELELSDLDWAPNTRARQEQKANSRRGSAIPSPERTLVETGGAEDSKEGRREAFGQRVKLMMSRWGKKQI